MIADPILVSARLDSLSLALDTLRVASNVADLHGSGGVTMQGGDSSAIRISGHINDLSPLIASDDDDAVRHGDEQTRGHFLRASRLPALEASASVRALAYGAVRASGVDVSASALLALPDSGGRALRDARLALAERCGLKTAERPCSNGRGSQGLRARLTKAKRSLRRRA